MDAVAFETALRRDGFGEIETKTVPGPRAAAPHEHPYDVRALVIDGEITLTVDGATRAYRAGEVFTMPAGCRHAEAIGAGGLHYLVGRRHQASRNMTMADMPAQSATAPASKAAARARFFNSGNAFNVTLPPVPDAIFAAEPARALDPATPTGLIACDQSAALGCDFPATTPLVLARYARIRPGESLTTRFAATGSLWYVIAGSGATESFPERIVWSAGDVFVLPGGLAQQHRAGPEGAVLWVVTNEPQLAFENLQPSNQGRAPTEAVHYPAAEIDRQIDRIYQVAMGAETAGLALIFSSDRQEAARNALPSLTLAMNTLPPGEAQRAHRHNSVAVSLIVRGQNCYSTVDGRRKAWSQWATTVTPPTSVHSHHNDGSERALFLIVQDGGLHYHARTMGFAFA